MKINSDHLGVILSCSCLLHCLALPFILVGMGMYTEESPFVHAFFLLGAISITGHAMWHSYKKHCKCVVLFFGAAGIIFLGIDAISGLMGMYDHGHGLHVDHIDFSHAPEVHIEMFTIIGSLFLVATHLTNLFYSKTSSKPCPSCDAK